MTVDKLGNAEIGLAVTAVQEIRAQAFHRNTVMMPNSRHKIIMCREIVAVDLDDTLVTNEGTTPIPGACKFMQDLGRDFITVICTTSTREYALRALAKLGLRRTVIDRELLEMLAFNEVFESGEVVALIDNGDASSPGLQKKLQALNCRKHFRCRPMSPGFSWDALYNSVYAVT